MVRNSTQIYEIGRVEVIESTTDGSEVISFEKKEKMAVRVRCSLYTEDNDVYLVSEDAMLTKWKAPSAIIGVVDLQPVIESSGKYKLHPESKARLQELGFSSRNAKRDIDVPLSTEVTEDCENATGYDEEFYEVEEVLSRRLSKDTLSYEYKVRFKGYGEEDDMWLPSSFFNRPITFALTSKFGRKRKHTLDPDIAEETPPQRKQHKKSFTKSPQHQHVRKCPREFPRLKRTKEKPFVHP